MNEQNRHSDGELTFALSAEKVPIKLFNTEFVKRQNFFKFSGYFGRNGLKQSGNSLCTVFLTLPAPVIDNYVVLTLIRQYRM
jgi:hypothetical protein